MKLKDIVTTNLTHFIEEGDNDMTTQPHYTISEVKEKLGHDIFDDIQITNPTDSKEVNSVIKSIVRKAYKHIDTFEQTKSVYGDTIQSLKESQGHNPELALAFYTAQTNLEPQSQEATVWNSYLYYALRLVSEQVVTTFAYETIKLSDVSDNF